MSPGQFIAPYRGYVVNQNEIRTITTQGIVMRSGAVIPLKEGDFRSAEGKLNECFLVGIWAIF